MWTRHAVKLLAAGALAVVALGTALVYRGFQEKNVTSFVPEFEQAQSRQTAGAGVENGIEIPGYSEISIPADTTDVQIDLTNPDGNDVYFRITFRIGEETIYRSKLIRPGDHLYDITLDRALPAGRYDLTIQYDTFAMDDSYSPRNGATVNCILQAS